MTIPTNPIVKGILTFAAAVCVLSSQVPGISQFATFLAPLGTMLLGALHVQMPTTTAAK